MTTLFVDYAWARPAPADIVSAGYGGVLRYLSTDPTKNLSATEAAALHSVGLRIGLVWETTANRAYYGFDAGAADAVAAEAEADKLGYPADAVLFYAVDFNASVASVAPYFQGVEQNAKRPVGIYGSDVVCEGGLAPYKWQTSAWSNGLVSAQAHLYQRFSPTVPHPLLGCDENVLLHDLPLWDPDGSVTAVPASYHVPAPTPAPAPTQQGTLHVQDIDLRNASDSNLVRGPGVAPMQRLLGVTADGLAGNNTRAALGNAQHRAGLNEDFVFGPMTAEALLAGK